MRLLVAGVADDGRSAIVREDDLPEDPDDPRFGPARPGGTGRILPLWSTEGCPPEVSRPSHEPAHSVSCKPGDTVWRIWIAPPGGESHVHRTDTVSYNYVISGQIDLILEHGPVPLRTGDCLVCLGVMHGWKVGPAGATLMSSMIGLDPV